MPVEFDMSPSSSIRMGSYLPIVSPYSSFVTMHCHWNHCRRCHRHRRCYSASLDWTFGCHPNWPYSAAMAEHGCSWSNQYCCCHSHCHRHRGRIANSAGPENWWPYWHCCQRPATTVPLISLNFAAVHNYRGPSNPDWIDGTSDANGANVGASVDCSRQQPHRYPSFQSRLNCHFRCPANIGRSLCDAPSMAAADNCRDTNAVPRTPNYLCDSFDTSMIMCYGCMTP